MLPRGRMKEQAGHGYKNVSSGEESIRKEVQIKTYTLQNQTWLEGKSSKILPERKNKKNAAWQGLL